MRKLNFVLLLSLSATISFASPTGSYSLPVDKELADSANWNLQNIQFTKTPENIEISFDLPEWILEGSSRSFKMSAKAKASEFYVFKGEKTHAICTESETHQYVCLIRFMKDKLKFNSLSLIQEKLKGKPDAEKKIKIAKIFSSDPIGVLKIQAE